MDSNKTKSIAKLSVFTIAIMNVTAVVSLRGLPAEAEYGLSSAFYYLSQCLPAPLENMGNVGNSSYRDNFTGLQELKHSGAVISIVMAITVLIAIQGGSRQTELPSAIVP